MPIEKRFLFLSLGAEYMPVSWIATDFAFPVVYYVPVLGKTIVDRNREQKQWRCELFLETMKASKKHRY
jgi:hypothetical protein